MQVPRDFQFPNPKLREGLQFWLKGQSVSQDGRNRVRPFRKLEANLLPKKIRAPFYMKWKPIFTYLERGAELGLPEDTGEMTADEVNGAFDKCVDYLKRTVSYCWRNRKVDPLSYTIGTWSNKTSRGAIEQKGSVEDRRHMAEAGNRNRRKPNQKRRRELAQRPLYRHRQQSRQRRLAAEGQRGGGVQDEEEALEVGEIDEDGALVVGTEAFDALVRGDSGSPLDEEIEQEVEEEMRIEEEENEDGEAAGLERAQALEGSTCNDEQQKVASSKEPGKCSIIGCTVVNLAPDHICHHCQAGVHNLCAQSAGLTDDDNELNMYCSLACKQHLTEV